MPHITTHAGDEYVPEYDDVAFAPVMKYMPAHGDQQIYHLDRVMARMYPDIEIQIEFDVGGLTKYRYAPLFNALPPEIGGSWPFTTYIRPDYAVRESERKREHAAARRAHERRLERRESVKYRIYEKLAERERDVTLNRHGGALPRAYLRPNMAQPYNKEKFRIRSEILAGMLERFPTVKGMLGVHRRGEIISPLVELDPQAVNELVEFVLVGRAADAQFEWLYAVRAYDTSLFGANVPHSLIDVGYLLGSSIPYNATLSYVGDLVDEHYTEIDLRALHKLQPSEEKPEMVCYFESGYKLLKDRKTRTTLGKYLTRFLPHLPQSEVKRLADAYSISMKPANMQFIPNTAPDAWVWAYENGPLSCMTYNRECRYLNSGLSGKRHPVRAYAHASNALALAVLTPDGIDALDMAATSPNQNGTDMVLARAIVNVETKGWVRIYSQSDAHRDELVNALRKAGYRADGDCLAGQKLALVYSDEDGFTCPYLDGNYTSVSLGGNYLRVCDDGDFDGQNSTGWVEHCEGELCAHCNDRRVDPDDDEYVDGVGTVCSRCLDNYYTYAYVGRYDQEYIPDDQVVCVDGEYFLADSSVLSDHDIEACAVSGTYYNTNEMHVMDIGEHEGSWVHESEAYLLPGDHGYCTCDEAESILADLGIDENGDPVEEAA